MASLIAAPSTRGIFNIVVFIVWVRLQITLMNDSRDCMLSIRPTNTFYHALIWIMFIDTCAPPGGFWFTHRPFGLLAVRIQCAVRESGIAHPISKFLIGDMLHVK